MADTNEAPADVKTLERAVILKLITNLIALVVGAAVAMLANWLGVKAPDTITIPVNIQQAAPAPVVDGVEVEARPRLFGLRARIRAEIDRRANLATTDPLYISAEKASEANGFVGKLGDGHLIELLIKYGPDILAIVVKILAMLAVL